MEKVEAVEATEFQFTPLRKGRRKGRAGVGERAHFNSRPYARGDVLRGALRRNGFYFNSRPYARGDRNPDHQGAQGFYFNSRPYARGDGGGRVRLRRSLLFQFTPLRKGRRNRVHRGRAACRISIHALTQGATAKDMRFQQIFCSNLTNHRALTATPYNLQGLS